MRLIQALAVVLPVALVAQVPRDDFHTLVANYAAILKDYPTGLKNEAAHKVRLPMEATPEYVSVLIAHETRPELRQILLMARYFMLDAARADLKDLPAPVANYAARVNTSSMVELAGQITPDSPALDLLAAVRPDFLGWVAWHASGGGYTHQSESTAAAKAFAFYDQIIEKHPSRQVKLLAMESSLELHSRPRQIEEVKRGLARLEAFEPKAPSIAHWKTWLVQAEQEDKVAPREGNPIPAFQVEDLDHPGASMTPATFKGKYWLLDFWATWCGPCKHELPFVHKAYAKFHPTGLEVLSISSDLKSGDIAAFRKNPEHPMPWHHAFPQGKAKEDLVERFQVRSIPHVLLISPDGKILAMDEALRGDELEKTLGKYLKTK